MSVWDNYISCVENRGDTRRKVAIRDEKRYINTKLPDNLSYHTVEIDGDERTVAMINSDNLNEKTIISMPGETLRHGALVYWMDNYWLLTEKDANETLYAKGKLLQCNHLLKWIDEDHVIHEQWCVVEDGTKLKHMRKVCNGLVYGKLYAKRTLLYAGTPLELYIRNVAANSRRRNGLRIIQIGRSAAKPRTEERSTTIPDVGVGASAPKWRALNRLMRHGEDIVCALQKCKGVLLHRTGAATPILCK